VHGILLKRYDHERCYVASSTTRDVHVPSMPSG
jgi:hypothetical protein